MDTSKTKQGLGLYKNTLRPWKIDSVEHRPPIHKASALGEYSTVPLIENLLAVARVRQFKTKQNLPISPSSVLPAPSDRDRFWHATTGVSVVKPGVSCMVRWHGHRRRGYTWHQYMETHHTVDEANLKLPAGYVFVFLDHCTYHCSDEYPGKSGVVQTEVRVSFYLVCSILGSCTVVSVSFPL